MLEEADRRRSTNWSLVPIPQMWSMLAPHDGTAHKNLLLTWKKSADLLIDHLSRVKRYRDNLAEAWPPEKSKASDKYLTRLDDLIDHLSRTYYATVDNHHALGAATSALVSARQKIEAIHQQYVANQQELEAYATKLKNNAEVTGKWRPTILSPPVTAQTRQLDLQLQAQSVMSTLSTDLAQAQQFISTPKLYDPYGKYDQSQPFDPKGNIYPTSSTASPSLNSSGMHSAHAVYVHNSADHEDLAAPILGASTANSSLPTSQPPGSSTAPPQGPILSAVNPPIIQPTAPSTISGAAVSGTQFPDSGIGSLPISGFTSPRPTPTKPPVNPATGIVKSPSPRTQSPLAGGVIGSPPAPRSTSPGNNRTSIQRINPNGGIIGGQSGLTGGPLGSGRKSDNRNTDSSRRRWDPDNPWETEEGLSPILLPPEKKEIDPGPAIGLP